MDVLVLFFGWIEFLVDVLILGFGGHIRLKYEQGIKRVGSILQNKLSLIICQWEVLTRSDVFKPVYLVQADISSYERVNSLDFPAGVGEPKSQGILLDVD